MSSQNQDDNLIMGMKEAFFCHAYTPQNLGMLPQPDGFAAPKSDCGDVIELYLRVKDGVIVDARYMTEGCQNAVACGSALTTLLKGLPLKEAGAVDAKAIDAELDGLPPEHFHVAELAAETLVQALKDLADKRQAPWKKKR